MPHVVLEHSTNVPDRPDLRRVLLDLHHALAATGLCELRDIKSRAVPHDVTAVADGAGDRSFVAVSVAILDGRSDEEKGRLADAVFAVLTGAFPLLVAGGRGSLSVEVRDLHRASYRRVRAGAG